MLKLMNRIRLLARDHLPVRRISNQRNGGYVTAANAAASWFMQSARGVQSRTLDDAHFEPKVGTVKITGSFPNWPRIPNFGHTNHGTCYSTASGDDASNTKWQAALFETRLASLTTQGQLSLCTYRLGESQSSRLYPPSGPLGRRKMKCSSATMTMKNAVQ